MQYFNHTERIKYVSTDNFFSRAGNVMNVWKEPETVDKTINNTAKDSKYWNSPVLERQQPEGIMLLFTCSVLFFVTWWTLACKAPLSMGFSRQEYWSGLPCPPPGDLTNPGTEPASPILAGRFFTPESPGKPRRYNTDLNLEERHQHHLGAF